MIAVIPLLLSRSLAPTLPTPLAVSLEDANAVSQMGHEELQLACVQRGISFTGSVSMLRRKLQEQQDQPGAPMEHWQNVEITVQADRITEMTEAVLVFDLA